MINNVLSWVSSRFKEKTTYMGISAIAMAFGIPLTPEWAAELTSIGIGLAGLIGVFIKEGTK